MSDITLKSPRNTRSSRKAATATSPPIPESPENGGKAGPLTVFGNIDSDVNQNILKMREQSSLIVNEIGRMEIRKAQLIRQLNQMEAQTQALLKNEAQALGIPDGTPWQLTPDGVALGLPKD